MQTESASCTARNWDSLSGEVMTRSTSTVTLDASPEEVPPFRGESHRQRAAGRCLGGTLSQPAVNQAPQKRTHGLTGHEGLPGKVGGRDPRGTTEQLETEVLGSTQPQRSEGLVHTRSKRSLDMLELIAEEVPGVALTHDSILTYSRYVRNLTCIV